MLRSSPALHQLEEAGAGQGRNGGELAVVEPAAEPAFEEHASRAIAEASAGRPVEESQPVLPLQPLGARPVAASRRI